MIKRVKFGINGESRESKINWFLSLSLKKRYELALGTTELFLKLNPRYKDINRDFAHSPFRHIQVLRKK
jgi:hypothetical protein